MDPPLAPSDGTGTATRGPGRERLIGIDSIRFVASLWVMLSHYRAPALAGEDGTAVAASLFGRLMGLAFNGPVAVIVFFVISGLCIHYPQRSGAPLDLRTFYLRRYIRIGLPMLVAVAIGRLMPDGPFMLTSVLWSLYCELAYYTIYPLLLVAARRWGWTAVLAGSVAVAAGVLAAHPEIRYIWGFGIGLTWLVGLPCWVMGCLLAASATGTAVPSPTGMWAWRSGIALASMLQLVVLYHSGFGHAWTVVAFAIAVKPWLAREIAYARVHPPYPWLESAGSWSYSLYLCHRLYEVVSPGREHGHTIGLINWLTLVAGGLLFSYAFYLGVERPAHRLALAVRRRPAPLAAPAR